MAQTGPGGASYGAGGYAGDNKSAYSYGGGQYSSAPSGPSDAGSGSASGHGGMGYGYGMSPYTPMAAGAAAGGAAAAYGYHNYQNQPPHQQQQGVGGGGGPQMPEPSVISSPSTYSTTSGLPPGAAAGAVAPGMAGAKEREAFASRNRSAIPGQLQPGGGAYAYGGGSAQPGQLSVRNATPDEEGESSVVVHQDGGRFREEEDGAQAREIPPTYESIRSDSN